MQPTQRINEIMMHHSVFSKTNPTFKPMMKIKTTVDTMLDVSNAVNKYVFLAFCYSFDAMLYLFHLCSIQYSDLCDRFET